MIAVINSTATKPEDAELLSALALEAFDPLSTFGNDLVMHITVGYMLHSFIARRDNLGARKASGTLRGDRAVLDTPVLLPLLGTEEQSGPFGALSLLLCRPGWTSSSRTTTSKKYSM